MSEEFKRLGKAFSEGAAFGIGSLLITTVISAIVDKFRADQAVADEAWSSPPGSSKASH